MLQYFAHRHPARRRPWGLSHMVKVQLFQNMVMLHIKKIELQMQHHGSKYFAAVIPNPRDGVNRLKFNFSEYGHGAYQIKQNRTEHILY